jgi:6-pyruvoyltetrahydropterin/6-carboxytetrahydropterin synthase
LSALAHRASELCEAIAFRPRLRQYQARMFTVTKQISFCYGHRLLQYDGACRHLHGHNGLVEVEIVADKLDPRGMVHDFSDIKRVIKAWIDANLDHRMVLHQDDPILPVLRQMGEKHFVMDVNPTAENIARLIYRQARAQGLPVVRVRLWETPSSHASYGEVTG